MDKCFNGLTTVNVELTSRCNKSCWMCGRRKIEKDHPGLYGEYTDMDFNLIQKITKQLPSGIVVQLHNNGESLLYPRLKAALGFFNRQIRCLDTNGKLVVEKADEIIGNLETITISVFESDQEGDSQYKLIQEFLKIKGSRKPNVIIRCLGEVKLERYKKLNCIIAARILHSPMGSFKYKKTPTVPEIGICLDFLSHMAIRYDGKVSICVRFDPKGLGIIDDALNTPLIDIWMSAKRKEWLNYHIEGRRDKIPLCSLCEFWGVPTGYHYAAKEEQRT
ncbi:MAG: radical SAM/SPASM domain-containing protein [Candidatus Omnitrophota bacterium]